MYLRAVEGPRTVKLPSGQIMTRADLPDAETVRWVASRKAAVVLAVEHGLISKTYAIKTYGLSSEELESWILAHDDFGNEALKATAAQQFRQPKVD